MPKSQSFKGVTTVRSPMLQCTAHTSDCIGGPGWSWWGVNKRGLKFEGVRWACVRKRITDGRVSASPRIDLRCEDEEVTVVLVTAQTPWSPLSSRPELGMLVAWRSAQLTWSTSFLIAGGTEAFSSGSCNFRASKQVLETRKHKQLSLL